MYSQITALKTFTDKQVKGYKFEQIIREILPWSSKPPISISSTKITSEQLDAFFEWNGSYFIVETKAKEEIITKGSSDWEDFELKLRKRHGQCIGLFLSLGSVSESVVDAARDLNKIGCLTIVLYGTQWEMLENNYLSFDNLLKYMLFRVRTIFEPCPEDIGKVKKWCFDREEIVKSLTLICQQGASVFLRRFKHDRHGNLYVKREIEKKLYADISLLLPSKLSRDKKNKNTKGKDFLADREKPKQIILIRDSSGCGKTTLMINCSLETNTFFGLGKTASDIDIDRTINILNRLGSNYGLEKIMSADRPIVLLVDSLDEASKIPNKKQEIISILKYIDELNSIAAKYNLIAFPILFIFTLRDDYWRDWESVFEGQDMKVYRKLFSLFTDDEFSEAQRNYSDSYKYNIENKLSDETKKVLSMPFNLLIFSEAYEYCGEIVVDEVFDNDVMRLYFQRKREELLKRHIPGFQSNEFMAVCSEIAVCCVKSKCRELSYDEVVNCIIGINNTFKINVDDILLALKSEQILFQDTGSCSKYRFKHSRFLEYLCAYYIVYALLTNNFRNELDMMTDQIIDSGVVSMFRIYDYMCDISKTEFPSRYSKIEKYYSESKKYMGSNVSRLRHEIAFGETTKKEDIKLIIKHSKASDPEIIWDSFFVIAAKNNSQEKEKILEFFHLAWIKNNNKPDRWKLILKISQIDFLLDEKVYFAMSDSMVAKEWQVYLGLILENNKGQEFLMLWDDHKNNNIMDEIINNLDHEWLVVRNLFNIITNDEKYILGELIK